MNINAWRMYRDGSFKTKKKKPGVIGPITCRECGSTNVTLRKCSDGLYICDNCLSKEKK